MTYRMNGFDAYESAWDVMAQNLWNLLGYNLRWFAASVLIVFLIYLVTVRVFESWADFLVITLTVFLVLSPLWEAANIRRYGDLPSHQGPLPIIKIILGRLLFLLFVVPGYFLFILPGIYLHCRLSLYLPLLASSSDLTSLASLGKSWSLTRARFIDLYTLWIAIIVSKPVSLLPFGLGFLVERPAAGLAKGFMLTSCSMSTDDQLHSPETTR